MGKIKSIKQPQLYSGDCPECGYTVITSVDCEIICPKCGIHFAMSVSEYTEGKH